MTFYKNKKQEHLHENSQPATLLVAGFQHRLRKLVLVSALAHFLLKPKYFPVTA